MRGSDFDDLWARRSELWLHHHVRVMIPSLADLRRTKRFAAREKDLADLRLLDVLIAERGS